MKISEFLDITKGGYYFDPSVSPDFLSKLTNDFGVSPETVEFVGVKKKEYNMFSETFLLYRFSKSSGGIGDCLKKLGTLIGRIPLRAGEDFGIQEIDVARGDGYYIMFYLLRELTDNNKPNE